MSIVGGKKRKSGSRLRKYGRLHFKRDRLYRSSEPWERGKHAPKKGNPRYKPVRRRTKTGMRKVYILRKSSRSKRRH